MITLTTEPEWDPAEADLEKNCPWAAAPNLTHMHFEQADGSQLVVSAVQVMPDGTYGDDVELSACTLVQLLLPSQPATVDDRPVLISPFTHWVKSTIDYYDIDMSHAADREDAYSMGVSL